VCTEHAREHSSESVREKQYRCIAEFGWWSVGGQYTWLTRAVALDRTVQERRRRAMQSSVTRAHAPMMMKKAGPPGRGEVEVREEETLAASEGGGRGGERGGERSGGGSSVGEPESGCDDGSGGEGGESGGGACDSGAGEGGVGGAGGVCGVMIGDEGSGGGGDGTGGGGDGSGVEGGGGGEDDGKGGGAMYGGGV
jgi:hypothetical protein